MRTLFILACLITLIALFYAEEDWRGWHTWNQFKRTWEAKGEHFDFVSLVPAPVPEEQNFALTPVVASSYLFILDEQGHRIHPQNTNVVNRLGMPVSVDADWKKCPTNGSWAKGTKTDLKEWQGYYRQMAIKNKFVPSADPATVASRRCVAGVE